MRILRDSVVLLFCLFGGGVLGGVVLLVGTMCFYGVPRFQDEHGIEVQSAFLDRAHPIAGVIGAAVGAFVFVRSKRRVRRPEANRRGAA